jgi:hypothetical protein
MGLAEALRSLRRLAPAKHFEPSFEMLMIPLDSLLHGLSREVFNIGQHGGQRGRVRRRFVGGHRVRGHARVLESGAKESRSGCGVAVLSKEHRDLKFGLSGSRLSNQSLVVYFQIKFLQRLGLLYDLAP